jgi:DNA polymerase-3 subunit gamma/tau
MGLCESCQVRKEAAISGSSYVPQQSLLQHPVVLSKGILLFTGGTMYQALYRTLRPEVFSDLLGQEHIIKILTNQLGSNSVSHAYLFCGTRGTGKTTTARLLAKGVNCLGEGERPCGTCSNCESIRKGTFVDVMEIDAASNRGIDNIRELRESVKYPPALGRRKVYIIDEVHMLSNEAFNALLKTLEEPPENVMFILATTEPNKLPPTVLSRCMRLDFKRIPEKVLEKRMMEICLERGLEPELSGIKLIAGNADGSVRDGLSILDQLLAGGSKSLTREDVLELLGANSQDALIELSQHIHDGNIKEIFLSIDFLLQEGRDARQLIKDLVAHYRALLIAQYIDNPENLLNMSIENVARVKEQGQSMTAEDISRGIIEFSKTNLDARYSTQPRILLEITCIKLTRPENSQPALEKSKNIRPKQIKNTSSNDSQFSKSKELDSAKIGHAELWEKALSCIEQEKATFRTARGASCICEINKDCVIIEADSEFLLCRLQDNRELIENTLEGITGQRKAVVPRIRGKSIIHEDVNTAEITKEEVENNFQGITIEIEEKGE